MFHITEKESALMYFKDLERHTLELKKFSTDGREESQEILSKIQTSLDLWMAFLTRRDLLQNDHLTPASEGAALQKALDVLETMNLKPDERETYEDRLKFLRIEANTLKNDKAKGFQKGMEKGMEKGKQEGIQESLEKGIEKVALSLFQEGMTLDIVTKVTGLSINILKELQNS